MSKKNLICSFSVFLLIFALFIFPSSSYAVFNLTVTPGDGGYDLRFQRLAPADFKQSKEVTIRIESDIIKQYRVMQTIVAPLSSSDGTSIPDDQFSVYPLVNSNSKGTLIYRQEVPVSQMDRVLYTSDGAGDSDSFKLVYSIIPSDGQVRGSYYGKISFILVPIDSTQSQVVVSLNIYAELAEGSTPVVEVTTSSGMGQLRLSSQGMGPKNDFIFKENPQISVKVRGSMGVTYRIFQVLQEGGLLSGSGDEFDLTKVLFSVAAGDKGAPTREGDLDKAKTRELLYVSDASGSPDQFVITYKPAKDFRFQKTNFYKGTLNFLIEKEGRNTAAPQVVAALGIELDIAPLFQILVYSQGKEGVLLKFGDIGHKTGPKMSDNDIYVESNMGKPYQVIQRVAGPMVNDKGDKVPTEDFRVRVKDLEVQEEPKMYQKDLSAVKEGETVVFSSGPQGISAHFKMEYKLEIPPDLKAGDYTTQLGYSLSLN